MAMDFKKAKNKTVSQAISKTSEVNARMIRELPVDHLVDTPENEQIFGYLQADIDRLADEIQENGFDGTIEVMDLHDGNYQIISGHQRVRAVRQLGMSTIPCVVNDTLSRSEIHRKMLAANILRRNLSPLALARACDDYKKEVLANKKYGDGSTRDLVARFFGIGSASVSRYEAILTMPEEIQEMCKSQEFPYYKLQAAASFTAEQKDELLQKIRQYNKDFPDSEVTANILDQFIAGIKRQAEIKANGERVAASFDSYNQAIGAGDTLTAEAPAPEWQSKPIGKIGNDYELHAETADGEQVPVTSEDITRNIAETLEAEGEEQADIFIPMDEDMNTEARGFDKPKSANPVVAEASPVVIDSSVQKILDELTDITDLEFTISNKDSVRALIDQLKAKIAEIEEKL